MLKFENVSAGYGDTTILRDISFEIKEGETVSFVGSNGAGKSTIMKTIDGLVKPQGGRIIYEGRDITKLPAYERAKLGIVYVPEGRRLFGKLTVYENLLVGSYVKETRKYREKNLRYVFDLFPKLEERKEQKAGTLSGGEQQMLAIGRGLMQCPRLLLLDEPSLGIAPVIVDTLFDIIETLRKEKMTIAISEQNVGRALDNSDRTFVVQTGSIVSSGPSEEIKNSDMIQKAYLGM